MRIWSIHPKYLDPQGLVALWREALLAQKVLLGKTKGYKKHPQLIRFQKQTNPVSAIGKYLSSILIEAQHRGYHFDQDKIIETNFKKHIAVNRGQVDFEWKHFKEKVEKRNLPVYKRIKRIQHPEVHPLFTTVNGEKELWEKG